MCSILLRMCYIFSNAALTGPALGGLGPPILDNLVLLCWYGPQSNLGASSRRYGALSKLSFWKNWPWVSQHAWLFFGLVKITLKLAPTFKWSTTFITHRTCYIEPLYFIIFISSTLPLWIRKFENLRFSYLFTVVIETYFPYHKLCEYQKMWNSSTEWIF